MQKEVIKRQLIIDGIAQVKTRKKMLAQGILLPDGCGGYTFNPLKTIEPPYFLKEMEDCLGKSMKVNDSFSAMSRRIELIPNERSWGWFWPLEAIDH